MIMRVMGEIMAVSVCVLAVMVVAMMIVRAAAAGCSHSGFSGMG